MDKTEQRIFANRFKNSDVLLLDEFGRSTRVNSQLPETTFNHILRTRVQDARPTFLTTNMSVDELHQGYGSSSLSMLTELSMFHEFTGEDFRPLSRKRTIDEVESGETRPIT